MTDAFDDRIAQVLEMSRTTMNQMHAIGEGVNPMLHIEAGGKTHLILFEDAPRQLPDAYDTGWQLGRGLDCPVDAVFFISDSYTMRDEDGIAAETVARYNAGVPLSVMFDEGVDGVTEALIVLAMKADGKIHPMVQSYIRGNPIIWDEARPPEATHEGGATQELLYGIMGLPRPLP